jgi:Ser/Thr protein kinase RdoA (MazF antagonist)
MIDLQAEELCARFGLGAPLGQPTRAAAGWGGHNVMWHLATEAGEFAVKQVGRPLPTDADIERALAIELEACARGLSAPEPVLSALGNCYELIGGSFVRCHRWAAGAAKTNEDAVVADAGRMGSLVATLHGYAIHVPDRPSEERPDGLEIWRRLADAGRGRRAPWADLIRDNLDALHAVEKLATSRDAQPSVGSHRDLNAHNVLFDGDRLVLIDWDAAGPASPQAERANNAVLWSHNHAGDLDLDVGVAFLRGYCEGGGAVERDDPDALPSSLGGVIWWAQENTRMAIERCTDEQDSLATLLVGAILDGPRVISERQDFLRACIRNL